MDNTRDNTRTMSHLVAAAGVVTMLAMAAPAFAADYNSPGKPATGVAAVKTASVPTKIHHGWSRYRIASWYASHFRDTAAAPAVVQPASWGSRPFILMVGIGF
jgi:hypothetical protein